MFICSDWSQLKNNLIARNEIFFLWLYDGLVHYNQAHFISRVTWWRLCVFACTIKSLGASWWLHSKIRDLFPQVPHGAWPFTQAFTETWPPHLEMWAMGMVRFLLLNLWEVCQGVLWQLWWHGAQLRGGSRSLPWLMTVAGTQEPAGDMLLLSTSEVPPMYQAAYKSTSGKGGNPELDKVACL